MEHLHLILFLTLLGCAAVLTVLAVLDWRAADRILKESHDDTRN